MYENVKRLYDAGRLDDGGLQRAVDLGWITQEQYDYIHSTSPKNQAPEEPEEPVEEEQETPVEEPEAPEEEEPVEEEEIPAPDENQ